MQVVLGGVNIMEREDEDQKIPVLNATKHQEYRPLYNNGLRVAVTNDVGEALMS